MRRCRAQRCCWSKKICYIVNTFSDSPSANRLPIVLLSQKFFQLMKLINSKKKEDSLQNKNKIQDLGNHFLRKIMAFKGMYKGHTAVFLFFLAFRSKSWNLRSGISSPKPFSRPRGTSENRIALANRTTKVIF